MSRQVLTDISSTINVVTTTQATKSLSSSTTDIDNQGHTHVPLARPVNLPALPIYWRAPRLESQGSKTKTTSSSDKATRTIPTTTTSSTNVDDDLIPMNYLVHKLPSIASSNFFNPETATHFLTISDLGGQVFTINPVSGRPTHDEQAAGFSARLLFPIHDIVLLTSCANIPTETFINATTSAKLHGRGLLAWQLPDPSTFPILLEWIYYRDVARLEFSIKNFAHRRLKLRETSSLVDITKDILTGLSKNGNALGVYNHPEAVQLGFEIGMDDDVFPGIWDLLDHMWRKLHTKQ